ncbi:WXG100 family type VII secretion target [Mycolicibacterium novocastrense]|nr:WXG100 family type VII secretion target [Mycolicibacterium novocastrense]
MTEKVYNYAGIDGSSSELSAAVAQTENLLVEGKGSLTALAAVWGGASSEAYQAVQMRWDTASMELNAALKNLAATIQEAGGTGGTMFQADRLIESSFGA